jgi:tRNA(Ile)-lysidine synthase
MKYCEDEGIIFEGTSLSGFNGGNFENYAREYRYNFFESVLKKYNTKYLFTAHHGDDLVETVLMRLSRGSSLKGYGGFEKITHRSNYLIVRPLIYLTKEDIMAYLDSNKIPYAWDQTNDSLDYTRNRFRHLILPKLHEEEKDVHLKFLDFSEQMHEMYDYIQKKVNRILKVIYVDNVLDISEFKRFDYFLQKEMIYKILRTIYINDLYVIEDTHVEEIFKLIRSSKPNIILKLPNGLSLVKEYNRVIFSKEEFDPEPYIYVLRNTLNIDGYVLKVVSETQDKSNYTIRLNSKNIKMPILVRTRRNGDRMHVKNMDGTKKINDIFVDNKVGKLKRDRYPIVTDANNNILWVPGLKKSNLDIPINGDYDIIIRYEKERQNE